MKKIIFFITFYLSIFIFIPSALARDDKDIKSDMESNKVTNSSEYDPGTLFVSFFKEYISPVDSDRCPSIPSCSEYSLLAFKKHGFFMGWLMTVDRLLHEGKEETHLSPLVYANDRWKIYDPVENNDFWWFPLNKKDKDYNE